MLKHRAKKHSKTCIRRVEKGAFKRVDVAGTNQVGLPRKLARALSTGDYELVLSSSAAGKQGKASTAVFKVS